jgi:hypothetical protein
VKANPAGLIPGLNQFHQVTGVVQSVFAAVDTVRRLAVFFKDGVPVVTEPVTTYKTVPPKKKPAGSVNYDPSEMINTSRAEKLRLIAETEAEIERITNAPNPAGDNPYVPGSPSWGRFEAERGKRVDNDPWSYDRIEAFLDTPV